MQAQADQHPEWKPTGPFASVLKRESKGIAASGKKGFMEMLAATHAGMTVDEFDTIVSEWIRTARSKPETVTHKP